MKKRIKTRSAKNKGARLQKWIAERISRITGLPVEKDGDIESRQMGQSGVDVILRGNAKQIFNFAVEAKNQEKWSVHEWIKQAKENINNFDTWLLFCKRNNQEPVVIMDAEEFFKIYKIIIDWELGDKNNGN